MSVSKNCLWDDFRDSNHNDEPIFYNQNVRNKYFTISYIINFCMWSTKMILLAFFCTIWAFASQFVLKVGVLNSWLDNINWRKILITGLPGRALSRKPLWLLPITIWNKQDEQDLMVKQGTTTSSCLPSLFDYW